jgi:hypothetical protein
MMKSSRASRPGTVILSAALAALSACGPPAPTPDAARTQQSLAPQSAAPQTPPTQASPRPPAAPADEPNLCPGRRSPLPKPADFVNDYAKVVDEATEARLETRLAELKQSSGVEFAVVTVETTGGRDIFEYSLDVACGWGIGPKAGAPGGGLLLLVAVKDRNWRVQVSRQLEADLPAEVVKEFGDRMTQSFRRGEFGPGVETCVGDHIERLAGRGRAKAAGD